MDNPATETRPSSDGKALSTEGAQRAIHVLVPDAAYWRAKDAAYLSRMSFKAYISRLLLEAEPFKEHPAAAPS